MKVILEYISFYLKLVFFVGCATFAISFLIYTLGKLLKSYDMTIVEIFLYSISNAVGNGVILGLIALIILTVLSYYHLGKEKLEKMKLSRNKELDNDP